MRKVRYKIKSYCLKECCTNLVCPTRNTTGFCSYHFEYKQSPEKLKQYNKKYREKNKEKIYLTRETNPVAKLKHRLRSRLNRAIKSNWRTGSAIKDLGCSIDDFFIYIANQFKDGMSWDNYGKWHIDHIKPLSVFNLTDTKEIKQAVHYTNLQPLWATENLSKGARND